MALGHGSFLFKKSDGGKSVIIGFNFMFRLYITFSQTMPPS